MAPVYSKNFLYRLIWSIGHSPLRLVEFLQFLLIAWVLVQTLAGFGGYLDYGKPMLSVSVSVLVLGLVHAAVLVLRKDRPGIDWILLVPVPFLLYAWIHCQFLSPYPWNSGALFAVYLQSYVVFVIVYNSMHGVHCARWMLGLLQIPVLLAIAVAFLRFYLFPGWIQDVTRTPDPSYGYGAGGFFQDPVNLGCLIVAILPLALLSVYKHRFNGPVMLYYMMIVAILLMGLIMSTNVWGLITLLAILLVVPFFLSAKWRVRRKFWKWVLVVLPVVLFLLWFGTDRARERLVNFASGATDPAGEVSREVALAGFRSSAASGIGLGGYSESWESFLPVAVDYYSSHAIGSYHEILAETGIIGLVLFTGTLLTILGWSLQKWRTVPFIRLNHEVAHRLKSFPEQHPVHRRLRREKGRMPTRKVALGGLITGVLAVLLYVVQDFSLKLPVVLFYLFCMSGAAAALARGYECRVNRKTWILAAVMPFGLAVLAAIIGNPIHSSNHLAFTSFERMRELQYDPDQIFKSQSELHFVEGNLGLATQLVPGNGRAWALLSTARLMHLESELDSPEEVGRLAMEAIRKGLEYYPDSWELHFNAARSLLLTGAEEPAAMEHLLHARKLAPLRKEPAALYASLLLLRDPSSGEGRRILAGLAAADAEYAAVKSALRRADLGMGNSNISMLENAMLARQFKVLPGPADRVNAAGLARPE